MALSRFLIVFLLPVFCINTYGQQTDFATVDKYAISIGKADTLTIPQLTYKLTDRYKDPVLKTRAIYTWIAYNISYDCPAFHSPSRIKGEAIDVFKSRKGVCEGYANLFREMCSLASVQCVTVDGYARNMSETIGEELEVNHTWNAVRINEEWKLIDATWGSGYTDKKVKVFTQLNDSYFFADPSKFVFNHYPKLETWKLAKTRLSKKEFFNNPTIGNGYFIFGIAGFKPENGIIKVKAGKQVTIAFNSSEASQIKTVEVVIGEDKKQVALPTDYRLAGNTVLLNVSYTKPETYPLTIFVNNVPTLRYQLEVEE
jgi:transglutaminase/protease-like cytokinesis protein 3